MRTAFHGWKSPRNGLHWINVFNRLDRIWLWFCINMVHFLKRKQRRQELERDLDTIRNLPWHNETKTNKWKGKQTMNPDDDVEEAAAQDVREMKKASPHIPEENLRKLAVAAIAAEKRLKKVFFIDHNEDTPETVEILLQCWHIMPVARDEDEGETWWVLGMNNTAAHDASTAGPFSTKDEAFAIALEHNRKFRVNAVYVHFRDENGKMSGDFEEPTETQLTLLEQSIIEIGDKAMQDVLDDLASEQDDDA